MRRTRETIYISGVPSSDVPITRQFFVNFSRTPPSRRRLWLVLKWRRRDAAVGLSSALPINPIQNLTRSDGDGRVRLLLLMLSLGLALLTPHSVGVTRLVLRCNPFSHVKSKRLLPLVGNPRHETQPIAAGLSGTQCKPREETRQNTHILRRARVTYGRKINPRILNPALTFCFTLRASIFICSRQTGASASFLSSSSVLVAVCKRPYSAFPPPIEMECWAICEIHNFIFFYKKNDFYQF